MLVYRYIKEKYLDDPLSSYGSKKTGGRWNSIGTPILYCSLNPSTAQLEILAGVNDAEILSEFHSVCIEVPDDYISIDINELNTVQSNMGSEFPWDHYPRPDYTQKIGDYWCKSNESLALVVPSSLCPLDWNVLLNTEHPDFDKAKVVEAQDCLISPRLINIKECD